ncbi:MAG TPA: DUF3160 domain-containing protein, partial [Polyangiaceae bacterium]|nr:DUF3160 domain-containing protein [Polyangiaceae bacterium]
YAVPFTSDLGYDPLTALRLDLIQQSSLALGSAEQSALSKNGFVISERRHFPSFVYGYATLYMEDLPLYISADSILYAVHESYDAMLASLETAALIPALDQLLDSMRGALARGAASALSADARAHTDVYLSVAKSLLAGQFAPPIAGGNRTDAQKLFDGALAASGWENVTLFDVARRVDFSQFTPRGHYTDSEELSRYFRAMMWLGRIDFRILETQDNGAQVFHRKQLEAAYVLRELMDGQALANWRRIDTTVEAFVGEPDNMVLSELDSLLNDLGLAKPEGMADLSAERIAQAVVDGGYGTQRISSHIMINGLGTGTLPLSSSFLLFGQRYVLDSHVFSNVVYDRVQGGSVKRMMPNPLDASFAALGNSQAGQLLASELQRYGYASDLASMRVLADAHPAAFWDANLYNLWLGALRTLSPNANTTGLPKVATTEAWGRRLLNTQHASWAELRHDTILYAKQSYTSGAVCEFPDAYVDPYPELFARIAQFASRGASLTAELDLSRYPALAQQISGYFSELQSIALTLEQMAQNQRTGTPHSAEHMAFINETVEVQLGCGAASGFTGWYARLFFKHHDAIELDPVIADVHTQPTDEGGNPVGRVLHVGTGMPRLMVVTANTCSGPRAYVGLASSYFEKITENFERLDDKRWKDQIVAATPPDVPWMQDIVVR